MPEDKTTPALPSGTLVLTKDEWQLIFNSLDLARETFANNPVLVDSMDEGHRELFIEEISSVMDKIGFLGQRAYSQGTTNEIYRMPGNTSGP